MGETVCETVCDENLEKSNNITNKEGKTASESKKPKPRSFSLLEMVYNKDNEGKGHGRLVRQKSVNKSFEKETHVLTHATSAPAAISDAIEPHVEDDVFGDGEGTRKKSGNQRPGRDDTTSNASPDVGSTEKIAQDGKVEESGTDQGSDSQNINIEQEGEEDRKENKREVVAGDLEEDQAEGHGEKIQSNEEAEGEIVKNEAETFISQDAGEKDGDSTQQKLKMQKDSGDIDALTQGLQTGLKLEDSGNKVERKDKLASKEVSALADDLHQVLSLGEKSDKKPVIITSVGNRINSTENGPTRLRAKGLHKGGAFVQQPQWLPSQPPPSSSNWQMWAHPQNRPLPPFPTFLTPQSNLNTSQQPNQSVISPPGQGNHVPKVFIDRPAGPQMLKKGPAGGMSMQIEHAQQNLYKSPHQLPQNYPQNSFNISVGSPLQMSHQQQMNIPGESTGTPSEVDWPPTPESDISDVDSILEMIEEESVRSPVESEDPTTELTDIQVASFVNLVGLPSPQSSWGGSPVHSPYNQEPSPVQINGPWSPESNMGSPGDPRSPESSSFIQASGIMSSAMMTVSPAIPALPFSPPKRQRNNSSISTDSQEAIDDITRIKKFLKEEPVASPIQAHCAWPYPTSLTPPYNAPSSAPPTPARSPQAPIHVHHTPVHSQHPPPCMYPQSEKLPEPEVDAFRKYVAEWCHSHDSVDDLMDPDEDNDTVLHIAICQMKVTLSLAIIEYICARKEKQNLNAMNKLRQTPLYLSVIANHPILTQIMINYGADPTIGNKYGNTPLHAAAKNGNNDAIKAICEGIRYIGYSEENARDLFNNRNYDGKSPLMLAIESHGTQNVEGDIINCQETVQLLLQTCASSQVQDSKSGKTALHYAVELRKVDLILILLENCDDAGMLVNCQMSDGNTALHLIVGRCLPEAEILSIVNLLMTWGANVGLDNAAKEKPLDLVHREHVEIKRRLHGHCNRNAHGNRRR